MKSKSTIKDFEERLKELTAIEPGIWFVTPYQFNGKPFCGNFDSSTFDLTRNSFWSHVKHISIKGAFRPLPGGGAEVEYKVGLSKKMKIITIVFFVISLIVINTFMIGNGVFGRIENYVINVFWIFAFIFGQIITKITSAIVKERFKTEFEIIDEE